MNHRVDLQWESDSEDIWAAAANLFLDDAPLTMPATPVFWPQETIKHEYPAPIHSTSTERKAPPTKRVNRRREELLYLREQVHELEQRLAASQLRSQLAEKEQEQESPEHEELLRNAWAAIAAQQLAQRQQSEYEHERLVTLIEEQRRHAKALQRFVRRIQSQATVAPPMSSVHLDTSDQAMVSSTVYDDLQRAIVSMYHQQEAIFFDARFDNVLSAFKDCRVVNSQTPQVCVELLDTRVVPFDVQSTANAAWQSAIDRFAAAVTYNKEELQVNENIIKKGFIASLNLPKASSTVEGKVVSQRVDQGNRVVILRATQFSSIGLPQNDSVQFSVRHYQWTVIEAPRHERLRGNHHACAQIESFDLSFPTVVDPSVTLNEEQEAAMVEFCKSAVGYHLDLSRQTIENILVINSTRQSSPSAPYTQGPFKLEAH